MSLHARALAPTPAETRARAVSDLRMGLACLAQQGTRQWVLAAVETLTQARLDALRGLFGTPELILTAHRARAVRGQTVMPQTVMPQAVMPQAVMPQAVPSQAAMTGADGASAPVRVRPPDGAGIDWFRGLSDSASDKGAGPRGPLHLLRGGDGAVQAMAIGLVKSAQLLPAALLFSCPQDADLPAGLTLTCVDVPDIADITGDLPVLGVAASAVFPLFAADRGRLHVFRDATGAREHYALEIGSPDRALPVLARLHSACFTGDVLGSLKCDCGPQLRAALTRMGDEGAGVLLYLNQEGRGIGLANKMRVYDLQSQGFDTVDANLRLGFDDDERDFRVAAVMLRSLGFGAARLLTNNPAKVRVFRAQGIEITEQLPLRVGRNAHNSGYLATKALKSGHAL